MILLLQLGSGRGLEVKASPRSSEGIFAYSTLDIKTHYLIVTTTGKLFDYTNGKAYQLPYPSVPEATEQDNWYRGAFFDGASLYIQEAFTKNFFVWNFDSQEPKPAEGMEYVIDKPIFTAYQNGVGYAIGGEGEAGAQVLMDYKWKVVKPYPLSPSIGYTCVTFIPGNNNDVFISGGSGPSGSVGKV